MRSLVAFLVLAAVGCTIQAPEPSGGCSKDTDCRSGRICQAGTCVDPSDSNPIGGDSSSGTPGTTKKGCGETVKQCNCGATNASPGFVEPSQVCASGYQGYDVCGQCPYGGYAWYAMCVCQ
jgi:hypothetical protein